MSTRITASCDCGWTGGPYKSQGLADFAHRQHSCDRWRAKAAAAQRGRDLEASVDRTPKPCTHPRADHQHGTHTTYVLDRCRCRPCADANSTYERNRIRAHAYGRFTTVMVDADPIRDHIRRLQAAGLGIKTIADTAGVSHSTLTRLLYGRAARTEQRFEPPARRVKRDTAQAILNVTPDAIAGGARIDGTGTRRRLHALIALGWSQTKLAAAMGYELRNFGLLVNSDRDVTVRTARAVRAVYEQLWDKPAPARTRGEKASRARSLNVAARNGWVPPLAWDDDTIDDPSATPDLGEQEPVHGRRRFHLEDVEFVLDHEPFATAQQIGDRLGVGRDAIQQACRRAGRDDLVQQLARNARLAKEGTAA